MTKIRVYIFGKVQGVFFRHSACQEAQSLGLTGWVKNLSDGSVECEALGNPEQLSKFIDWCKKGPSRSQVENISIEWLDSGDLDKQPTGFNIIS